MNQSFLQSRSFLFLLLEIVIQEEKKNELVRWKRKRKVWIRSMCKERKGSMGKYIHGKVCRLWMVCFPETDSPKDYMNIDEWTQLISSFSFHSIPFFMLFISILLSSLSNPRYTSPIFFVLKHSSLPSLHPLIPSRDTTITSTLMGADVYMT